MRNIQLDVLKKDFEALIQQERSKKFTSNKKSAINESMYDSALSTESRAYTQSKSIVQDQYSLQRDVRAMFGKTGINTHSISEHPDFAHLDDDVSIKYQYICPLFVDIIGSTSLSLKYDLEFIYVLKNAVIRTCIEVIRAFDGYVHRIMGDAVLGFFGSSNISKKQSTLDCLNASVMISLILEKIIQPWITNQEVSFVDSQDFGFRIGCNFGNDQNVLWANYGFGNVGEISPTGFPIDLAAKLQGLAGKNKIMLGQDLLELINFPENFAEIKTKQKKTDDGVTTIPVPYVTPNYTNKNGQKINYLMRSLVIKKYIAGLPLSTSIKKGLCDSVIPNSAVTLGVKLCSPDGQSVDFYQNNQVIQKHSEIQIGVRVLHDSTLLFPLTVRFEKLNQLGFNNEAELTSQEKLDEVVDHTIHLPQNSRNQQKFTVKHFERDCIFSGIHQVTCTVTNKNGRLIFRDVVNVPIE
jgi:class 3 adenylate cyclase